MMQDYEKLGSFYLGQSYDLEQAARRDDLLLYDAKDLTTHAMIIGMTGSGKTGLGIGLIEEAAIDRIPVIAVDPKGDLGNVLLTFPGMSAQEFRPWVNPQEAAEKNISVDALAESVAASWKQGLADWGQDGERIRRLREAVDLAIYTPGSSAGLPISVLQSFKAPPQQLRDDPDLYRERIQATASSVLGLMGIEADPITSREHVLIANLFQNAWNAGQDLDIAGLIGAIQQPPFQRIGVLDLESFFPSRDRSALAMQLNTLLAAPGFEAWMQGEPLDTAKLLYTASGKPRVSVISIAHLSDRERMFFVSMLLNDIVSWMRTQPGTGSLRALFYMDELFGYMPPIANPPSKTLLLTLLKQARAFGLGTVLSTQNPVDLDYKGLSNIGTWFIGRLQTERDKARVMEGLEGAASGGAFDKAQMERVLAGLGKRVFLMRNVHENEPAVFTTRWTLSYLAGPLTRDQIKTLTAERKAAAPAAATQIAPAASQVAAPAAVAPTAGPPILPAGTRQYFLPAGSPGAGELVYLPLLLGAADVSYANSRYGVQETRRLLRSCPIDNGPVPVDWANSADLKLDLALLEQRGRDGAQYADLPPAAGNARSYGEWEKTFSQWLRANQPLVLLQSPAFKAVARAGETEGEFRARLQQLSRERRDEQVDALRKRYASRIATLQDRLGRAEQAVAREQAQASQQNWNAAASFGQSLLGAVFGRKLGGSSVSRVGSSIGRIRKESGDVARAEESAETLRSQLAELEAELQGEVDKIESGFDALSEPLEQITIAPKSSDIHIHFVGLGWAPHIRDAQGRLVPAGV
jgi:hypothetical protein